MHRILAGIFVCSGLLWANPGDPIHGVGISVGKKPKSSSLVIGTTSDGFGRVRFDITDPGDYTLTATQDNPPDSPVGLTFQGAFLAIATAGSPAPAGPLVTGANLNGNHFKAAGFLNPNRKQMLSVDFTVTAAVHFTGQFSAESPVLVTPKHLTVLCGGGWAPAASADSLADQ